MTSDVGMTKSVLPPLAQTSPTAPAGRAGDDARAVQESAAKRRAEEAEATKQQEPLDDMVSDLNQLVRELHRELRFSVDDDSGDTVIKVIDSETDEVLRQIPSKDLMVLRRRLEEAAGAIFHDSA